MFSVKRYDPVTGDNFYYLYNDGLNATTFYVDLENTNKQSPFHLDSWAGKVEPITRFEQIGDRYDSLGWGVWSVVLIRPWPGAIDCVSTLLWRRVITSWSGCRKSREPTSELGRMWI